MGLVQPVEPRKMNRDFAVSQGSSQLWRIFISPEIRLRVSWVSYNIGRKISWAARINGWTAALQADIKFVEVGEIKKWIFCSEAVIAGDYVTGRTHADGSRQIIRDYISERGIDAVRIIINFNRGTKTARGIEAIDCVVPNYRIA